MTGQVATGAAAADGADALRDAHEAAASYGRFLDSAAEQLERALCTPDMAELYEAVGLTPPKADPQVELEPIAHDDVAADGRKAFQAALEDRQLKSDRAVYELAQDYARGRGRVHRLGAAGVDKRFSSVQREIGRPGTLIIDGRIAIEENSKLRPAMARGTLGRPGEYEEVYRTCPVAMKHTNELGSMVCQAVYEPTIPQEVEGLAEVVERAHRHIQAACGAAWKANAATAIRNGFAPFENIWKTRADGFIGIHAVRFREQSITYRHLFDERQSEHVGTEFQTGGMDYQRFVLPRGKTPGTNRLSIVNINATGNNVEGVTPYRALVWIDKLEKLLWRTFGVSYQRWGVPMAKVKAALENIDAKFFAMVTGGGKLPDMSALTSRLNKVRGRLPNAMPVPPGLDFEFENPTGDMPVPLQMIQQLHHLKSMAFSNEGAMLGAMNFGSYAMAHVADNKFMRSAPAYALSFVQVFNELLEAHIRYNFERVDEIELMPSYTFRFAGMQDASKWIADAISWWQAEPWNMPDSMREMGAAMLSLPKDVFDDQGTARQALLDHGVPAEDLGATPSATVPGAALTKAEKVQDTALNGAQVASMVDVITQVSTGALPADAAVFILTKAFLMTPEEARDMVSPARDHTPPPEEEVAA